MYIHKVVYIHSVVYIQCVVYIHKLIIFARERVPDEDDGGICEHDSE